jgi:very-short-patch-repair endonuclease
MAKNRPDFHSQLITQARYMRANPTKAEALLWAELRKRQLGGYRFLRQRIFGLFIVYFFCAEANLIIEIYGPIHEFQTEYDKERTEYLENLGKKVIRFGINEIQNDLEGVLSNIERHCFSDSQSKETKK